MDSQIHLPSSSPVYDRTALRYLDLIKLEYGTGSHTYLQFLEITKQFKERKISRSDVVQLIIKLFKDKPHLIQKFAVFLPESEYAIQVSSSNDGSTVNIHVTTPEGTTSQNIEVGRSTPQPRSTDPSNQAAVKELTDILRDLSIIPTTDESVEWFNGHTEKVSLTQAPTLPEGYKFHASPPPLEAYLNLRRKSGLTPVSLTQGARSLKGGWYAAHITYTHNSRNREDVSKGEEVIGMGRVIGDGGWYFHICDMAVLPEHQRKGLGRAIMGALMQRLKDVAEPGFVCNLFADPPGRKLYANYGFVESSGELGMMQWVGGKGEKKGDGWWPKKTQVPS